MNFDYDKCEVLNKAPDDKIADAVWVLYDEARAIEGEPLSDPAGFMEKVNAFMEKGLFIEELRYKMSQEAINRPATEKNPNDSVGYVKTIYFAYLYMKQRGLLKQVSFKSAEKFDKNVFGSRIMIVDAKLELRADEEKKRDKRKKLVIDKGLERQLRKYNIGDKAKERLVTTTKTTAKVKNTKAVNAVKSSSKIKNKK